MGVQFDTRPPTHGSGHWSPKGEPLRARTCPCGPDQLLDEDDLCRHCGYYPKAVVDRTWLRQAKRIGFTGKVSALEEERRRRRRMVFDDKRAA
jgi:hypothetical protein